MEKLTELGKIVRAHNLSVSISYGSGGYCVVLTQKPNNKSYSGYAWGIEGAAAGAFDKFIQEIMTWDEETTKPDIKLP